MTDSLGFIAIWIDMLPADDWNAAVEAAELFSGYSQVEQFHDPNRLAGKAAADSLGARGQVAWDMYLFYGSDAEWGARPPRPLNWVHQLGGRDWADTEKYRWGDGLTQSLLSLAKHYLVQGE